MIRKCDHLDYSKIQCFGYVKNPLKCGCLFACFHDGGSNCGDGGVNDD